jgi:hypothetical protein
MSTSGERYSDDERRCGRCGTLHSMYPERWPGEPAADPPFYFCGRCCEDLDAAQEAERRRVLQSNL